MRKQNKPTRNMFLIKPEVIKDTLATAEISENLVLPIVSLLEQQHASFVSEVQANAAVGRFGGHCYQISLVKLCAALSILVIPAMDRNPLKIGIAMFGALAAIDNAIWRMNLDQAAVCQALYESWCDTKERSLSKAEVVRRFEVLTKASNVDKRIEGALAKLEDRNIVMNDPDSNVVTLCELIYLRKR